MNELSLMAKDAARRLVATLPHCVLIEIPEKHRLPQQLSIPFRADKANEAFAELAELCRNRLVRCFVDMGSVTRIPFGGHNYAIASSKDLGVSVRVVRDHGEAYRAEVLVYCAPGYKDRSIPELS